MADKDLLQKITLIQLTNKSKGCDARTLAPLVIPYQVTPVSIQ